MRRQASDNLKKLLAGAFSGPPTPLKDIPKKSGESRAQRDDQRPPRKRRKARKSRAA